MVDKKDNSVTRSRAIFERYFLDMGLMVRACGGCMQVNEMNNDDVILATCDQTVC